jgi:hypothetical protein
MALQILDVKTLARHKKNMIYTEADDGWQVSSLCIPLL